MQCLGGYGYCRDFPIEQYFRDIRIDPIHEGTTGIQGMDLLGRKTTIKKGKAYKLFLREANLTIAAAREISELKLQAEALARGLEVMNDVTGYLLELSGKGKIEEFLADSTLYLEMVGLLAIAWQWLIQGIVAYNGLQRDVSESDENLYNGKLLTLKYFFAYELPKVDSLAHVMRNSGGLTVNLDPRVFEVY
jgi:butyryl-CoA dehydrogenase